MKKTIIVMSLAMLTLLATSCSPNGHKNKEDGSAISSMFSDDENFVTPDLKLFNLKGHVKEVLMSFHADSEEDIRGDDTYLSPLTLNFDGDGILQKYDAMILSGQGEDHFAVKRDDQGRIMKLTPNPRNENWPEGGVITFKYNSQGYPVNISRVSDEGFPNMMAEFNKEGLPYHVSMQGYGSIEYNYKYTEFDAHGNWTKREVKFFMPAEYDGDEDVNTTFNEIRTITYYE